MTGAGAPITQSRLEGLIPPLALPMHDDETIDIESLQRQAVWLTGRGANGLWVNGTTGEFHALTPQERSDVVRYVKQCVPPDTVLIAQIGTPATRSTLELAEAAVAAGADALAVVTPYYLRTDDQELRDHYSAIKRAASVPLLIYQVPLMAKTMMRIQSVVELAREGVIDGIKDSSNDIAWFRSLLVRMATETIAFRAFVGGGSLVDVSLMAGASGAMCAIANIAPAHCARLVEAGLRADWDLASQLQNELIELVASLELPNRPEWSGSLAAFKFVLAERGIIDTAVCARPVRPIDDAEARLLRATAIPLVERLEDAATLEPAVHQRNQA